MNDNTCLAMVHIKFATEWELRNLKGIIYRISCLTNGKSYIGKTIHKFSDRYKGLSWGNYRHNKHFDNAKKKHGVNNFRVQILISGQTRERLYLLESYYIKTFRSFYNDYGYNKISEGLACEISDDIKSYLSQLNTKTTEKFIFESKQVHGDKFSYKNVDYKHHNRKIEIICSIHGSFFQTPNNHLQGRGCKHCAYNALAIIQRKLRLERKSPSIHKPVKQIDLETRKIIKTFSSGSEAERYLRLLGFTIARSTLTRTCRSQSKKRFGYIWEFINSDNLLQT